MTINQLKANIDVQILFNFFFWDKAGHKELSYNRRNTRTNKNGKWAAEKSEK